MTEKTGYAGAPSGENVTAELKEALNNMLNEQLHHIVLSNTREAAVASKVKIRPVLLKGQLYFQETLYKGSQVFHTNYGKKEMAEKIAGDLQTLFRQAQLEAPGVQLQVLVSKKGKMTLRRKTFPKAGLPKEISPADLSHNRSKQYILQEGKPAGFLVNLGVQTPEGKIVKAKYDKFRQINRYLELIEDVLEDLPKDRKLHIIDFGCGKSYLTFAMYYYLHELQKREIQVTGLDLKTEVIEHCNELAQKLGYANLHFEQGDISSYAGCSKADMVVTLHACDVATDFALEKAISWGAEVIMAVPCCQHELNRQIRCDMLQPVLKYGIIKERMSALITDALRAERLEQAGYDTQILEFIDMEHTPKNLMIRAVKSCRMQAGRRNSAEALSKLEDFLHISPTLGRLI